MDDWQSKIRTRYQSHVKPEKSRFQYGTAGFRMQASQLDSVMFTVGILAVLRSKATSKCIGAMITASHNPAQDNGVKLVDPRGEMLEQNWEAHATTLANADGPDSLVRAVESIIQSAHINLAVAASIVCAYDTRPSCAQLLQALKEGAECLTDSSAVRDAGLLTTPQLHYLVRCTNDPAYGHSNEQAYYDKMAKAFARLCKGKQPLSGRMTVDCANGVGAPKLQALLEAMPSANRPSIHIINSDIRNPEALNHSCGADYVKTNQKAPPGITLAPSDPSSSASASFNRYASLDGDADRLVYYYADASGTFHLLDGDKIAGLFAMYLIELVKSAGLSDELSVGVVQTAYANGNSTTYLKKTLKMPVVCTPTGVKYLHHAAEKFDIGVYFEANGHGTVLFSTTAGQKMQQHQPQTPAQQSALDALVACTELVNQTVGDALSDLLFVEAILSHKNWTCASWDQAYVDLPNRLSKVVVKDRNAFVTTDAERKLVRPEGLQGKIDELVGKIKGGRSFVRPSGTEDGVRVYAEAATKGEADELANKVSALIAENYGVSQSST